MRAIDKENDRVSWHLLCPCLLKEKLIIQASKVIIIHTYIQLQVFKYYAVLVSHFTCNNFSIKIIK